MIKFRVQVNGCKQILVTTVELVGVGTLSFELSLQPINVLVVKIIIDSINSFFLFIVDPLSWCE